MASGTKGARASGGARKAAHKASAGEGKEHFGPSEARVRYTPGYDATDQAKIRKDIKAIFGRELTDREIASMVGAPNNAMVNISEGVGRNTVQFNIDSSEMSAIRTVKRNGRGEIVFHNDIFVAFESGKGLGTKVFGRQVEQAARLGVSKIETTAARSDTFNGYYTWARLGYDGNIPARVSSKLPAGMKKATRVSDLMKTEAGRAFWKANGVQMEMSFDLKPGSTSRRTLNDYVKSKGR